LHWDNQNLLGEAIYNCRLLAGRDALSPLVQEIEHWRILFFRKPLLLLHTTFIDPNDTWAAEMGSASGDIAGSTSKKRNRSGPVTDSLLVPQIAN
jgi:hypothetical protein